MIDPSWNSPAFWVSMVAVLIAGTSALATYYTFRSQVDPLVIVYLAADEKHTDVIRLVIENIGKGLARNVSFELSEPLLDRVFDAPGNPPPQPMKHGPFIDGIPALAPGTKRTWAWGEYEGLRREMEDRTVFVRVRCTGDRAGVFHPAEHEEVYPIELRSFEGTNTAGTNWEQKSANQLERIAKVLNQAGTSTQPLKVELRRPLAVRKRPKAAEGEAE
jgi:hypothetical protein